MRYITKQRWEETKKRYLAWWANGLYERPLLYVVAKKPPSGEVEDPGEAKDPVEMHTNIEYVIRRAKYRADTHAFMGDTYPKFSLNLGPGTLALYLGSEPHFAWDTVWFDSCMKDIHEGWRFRADPNAKWFRFEMAALKYAMAVLGDDFFYCFPDIIENIDILAAMRGPQDLCVDLIDEPDEVKRRIAQIDVLYEYYYDLFYDVIRYPDGSSFFSAFDVWGPGRTAKIQCDFSAMISVSHFREFVLPSLVRQCGYINNTVYHLDGPQAVKHVPALMEIKQLNALQFTCGEMRPDGTNEEWWPVYDQARKAGKALWVQVYDGGPDQWIKNIDRFIARYGANGMYFRMPEFENEEIAREFIHKAELDWH